MDREANKVELYLLLCQSATALLVSLINTTRSSSPEIQMVIKRRMLQLVKILWEFVRDSAHELDDMENTLEPSEAATDLHSRRVWQPSPQPQPQPTPPPAIPRLPHHSTFVDQRPASRFPVIQRLLQVLARVPNEEFFAQAAHPFANDPAFRQRLQHEMYQLRRMLGDDDPSLHFDEQTLLEKLNRMETSMRLIMEQLDALTTSPQEETRLPNGTRVKRLKRLGSLAIVLARSGGYVKVARLMSGITACSRDTVGGNQVERRE